MALVYQKRKYGNISHTYKCTTYLRDKDKCPKPNTLLHRQIKEIVEIELRNLAQRINKDEFIDNINKSLDNYKNKNNIELEIKKLEAKKNKLYQITKKVYDDTLNGLIDDETSSRLINEYTNKNHLLVK